MKKKKLLFLPLLLAVSFVAAQNYTLQYDWSSVVKFKKRSGAMWSDVSADGNLLILSRFQTQAPDDIKGSFLGREFTGPASTNTSGSNSIVLTKSDFKGKLLWAVSSDKGDVQSDLNSALATKDGGAFLALTVRHTEKSDATDNILLRITDEQKNVHTLTWERVQAGGEVTWINQPVFVKISAAGKIEWIKRGEVGYEPAPAKPDKLLGTAFRFDGVTEDENGNLYVGGCIARKMTVDAVSIDYHNVSPEWDGDFVQKREGCSFLLKLDKNGTALSGETSGGEAKTDCPKNMLIADGKLYMLGTVKGLTGENYSWGDKSIAPATSDGVFMMKKDLASGNVEWLSYFPSKFVNNEELRLYDGKLVAVGRFTGNITFNPETTLTVEKGHTGLIFTVDAATGNPLKGAVGTGRTNYTGLFFKNNHIWVYGYGLGGKSYLDLYTPDLTLVKTYKDVITGGGTTSYNCAEKDGKLALIFTSRTPITALGGKVIQANESGYGFMAGVATFNITPEGATGLNDKLSESLFSCRADKATLQLNLSSKALIRVYGAMGVPVLETMLDAGISSFSLPQGIYLVEALGQVQKVFVP